MFRFKDTPKSRLLCFFNDTATTEIYTSFPTRRSSDLTMERVRLKDEPAGEDCERCGRPMVIKLGKFGKFQACSGRSEEHTSELQSRQYLVCRLLLEKNTRRHLLVQDAISTERNDSRLA